MVENMCGACPRKRSSGSELALQLGRKSARTDRFSSQDSELRESYQARSRGMGLLCVLLYVIILLFDYPESRTFCQLGSFNFTCLFHVSIFCNLLFPGRTGGGGDEMDYRFPIVRLYFPFFNTADDMKWGILIFSQRKGEYIDG